MSPLEPAGVLAAIERAIKRHYHEHRPGPRALRNPLLNAPCHRCAMAQAYNGNGGLQWPARMREVIENIEPVNAPSCYRVSLLSGSLEVRARLKSVDDLDLLMNVLESNRAFFVKNDLLAAEVLTLT